MLQRNTILFWLIVSISIILTLILTNNLDIKKKKINYKKLGLYHLLSQKNAC